MTDGPAPRSRGLALVAEDDRDIRELVAAKLAGAGFEVTAFGDGLEALEALRERVPAIALLDVMMPGISGLDIIGVLASEPHTKQIPVILLSAKSQEFDVQTGIATGAADYVVKPFSPRDLLSRVNEVLARTQP